MTSNRDNILKKIRALMAKTIENGCTEAEAMSAITMAEAMMAAYEVTEDDLTEVKGEKANVGSSDMRDTHKIREKMATAVARFTECKVWSSGKSIKFCGLQADIEFGIWLLETLAEFVRKELKNHIWGNELTALPNAEKRIHINGFVIGCCNRIGQRLNELVAARTPTSNSKALVVAKQALIDLRMKDMGLALRQPRARGSRVNVDSQRAGHAAGDRASFGRPVGGAGGVLRLK